MADLTDVELWGRGDARHPPPRPRSRAGAPPPLAPPRSAPSPRPGDRRAGRARRRRRLGGRRLLGKRDLLPGRRRLLQRSPPRRTAARRHHHARGGRPGGEVREVLARRGDRHRAATARARRQDRLSAAALSTSSGRLRTARLGRRGLPGPRRRLREARLRATPLRLRGAWPRSRARLHRLESHHLDARSDRAGTLPRPRADRGTGTEAPRCRRLRRRPGAGVAGRAVRESGRTEGPGNRSHDEAVDAIATRYGRRMSTAACTASAVAVAKAKALAVDSVERVTASVKQKAAKP